MDIIKLNNDTIVWNSRKQPTIALSTCESEYMSISSGCQEIQYITNLLHELKIQTNTTLFCDNKAAISIAQHDSHHQKTQVDLKLLYYKNIQLINPPYFLNQK